jgi:Pacifastin inhibitor (LCMII)
MESSTTSQTPAMLIIYSIEEANDPNFRCTPGGSFYVECNMCGCVDGIVAACTLKGCFGWTPTDSQILVTLKNYTKDEIRDHNFRCGIGELLYVECNKCICGHDSMVAACTSKLCVSQK